MVCGLWSGPWSMAGGLGRVAREQMIILALKIKPGTYNLQILDAAGRILAQNKRKTGG